MIIQLGVCKLDVDPDRTRQFYRQVEFEPCTCDGCRNFYKAHSLLPEEVCGFFRRLGVDIGKPAEMSAFVSRDGNLTYYWGFYHICGTILEGKDPWIQVGERQFRLDESCALKLTDEFSVFFTGDCALLEKDFPSPAVQIEVQCHIPWVLEEPNSYWYPNP